MQNSHDMLTPLNQMQILVAIGRHWSRKIGVGQHRDIRYDTSDVSKNKQKMFEHCAVLIRY